MATERVETFATKDEWKAARSTGIGASDAPVILGLSKWKSPLALYYEKRGLREESRGESEHLEWGLALEPAIIGGYERITKRKVLPASALLGLVGQQEARFAIQRDKDLPFLMATPDAAVAPIGEEDLAEGAVQPIDGALGLMGTLEVKNVDISQGREWEEAQEPPLMYTVQCLHQMMVSEARWGSIAGLVGGNRFMWADIARDEELIRQIRALEIEFWDRVIAGDPPPVDGSDSTKALLKRLYPKDSGRSVDLPIEAIEIARDLIAAKSQVKAAERRKQEAENKIRALMGDATTGVLPGGGHFTHKTQYRREFISRASEFRVLRGSLAALGEHDDE